MIGVRYTSTAEGETAKFVTCKGCGHGYGYWMTRRGSSSNTSWFLIGTDSARNRSGREAEGEVAKRLRTEHDPVPCPRCGHYQKRMIGPAREEKFGWVFRLGLLLGFLFGAGCFVVGVAIMVLGGGGPWVNKVYKALFGMMLPGAVVIPAAAFVLKDALGKKYDPNADPEEERIARGRERAMSDTDYARLAPKPGPQLPPMP
jgi:hypothetical protein